VTKWPSYSPDLNHIEHFWFLVKNIVCERHQELKDTPTNEDRVRGAMWKAMIEVWGLIDQKRRKALLESMPARMEAVIEAKRGTLKASYQTGFEEHRISRTYLILILS
jgi:hypothetical protein